MNGNYGDYIGDVSDERRLRDKDTTINSLEEDNEKLEQERDELLVKIQALQKKYDQLIHQHSNPQFLERG